MQYGACVYRRHRHQFYHTKVSSLWYYINSRKLIDILATDYESSIITIISIDAEKAFDEIQHVLMINNQNTSP